MRAALIVLLTAAVSCRRPPSNAGDLVAHAEVFLRAAAAGDSVAMAGMVADTIALRTALTARAIEPKLLAAAASGVSLRGWRIEGDSAQLTLAFALEGRREIVAIGLLRATAGWRVYHLGFPGRQ